MTGSPHTQRSHGVCSGSLWRQYVCGVPQSSPSKKNEPSQASKPSNRTFEFCVLVGVTMTCYTDFQAYKRGDHPTSVLRIVGASAWNTVGNTASETTDIKNTSFRMVTFQGTHIYCSCPTSADRDCWLAALHAGLECSLDSASTSRAVDEPTRPLLSPPSPKETKTRRGVFAQRGSRVYCHSCGKTDCNELSSSPLPQYGQEQKMDVCTDCFTSQGLLLDVTRLSDLYEIQAYEQKALDIARELCYKAVEQQDSNLEDVSLDQSDHSDTHNSGHLLVPFASTEVLLKLIQSRSFITYRRSCPLLEERCLRLEQGGAPAEFLEGLQLGQSKEESEVGELKKQAFRVAGDMGSAMKLLQDHALGSHDTDMLSYILDFFLDLCEEGEISSVAFFWPQLRCIHLRMLPPENTQELARVDLLEDFLLTVSVKYSVQLALELIWGHVADLEDSLNSLNCSPSCRQRRFSVLRFVCELESLLFDFDSGWGGGNVSLRSMLSPSPHQVTLLRQAMLKLQKLRQTGPALTRSVRIEKLTHAKQSLEPEVAAQEALRIARNADYFSSHLSFTRRICDIAERLRFMDLELRAPALQKELRSLNASGGMGGDPLNRICDDLIRVVRIPPREGHVFRSKERTPVLLLMELLQEGVEEEESETEQKLSNRLNGEHKTDDSTKVEASAPASVAQCGEVDIEMPDDDSANEEPQVPSDSPSAERPEKLKIPAESSTDSEDTEVQEPEASPSDATAPEGAEESKVDEETGSGELTNMDASTIETDSTAVEEGKVAELPKDEIGEQAVNKTDEGEEFSNSERRDDVTPPPLELLPGGESSETTDGDENCKDTKGEGDGSGLRPDPDLIDGSDFSSSLAPFHSPRALGKLKRFESPTESKDDASPGTPTKAAVKELVNTALHMQLELPTLQEHGSGALDEEAESVVEDEPASESANSPPQSPREDSKEGRTPTRTSRLNRSLSLGNSRKMSALASPGEASDSLGTSPNDEIRREVLTTIMMKGMHGANAIASSAAAAAQRKLQDLDRKRAVELILHSDDDETETHDDSELKQEEDGRDVEASRKKLMELGLDEAAIDQSLERTTHVAPTEEDEAMEALRLLLLQNRVGQGKMSPETAAAAMSNYPSSLRNVSPRSPQSESSDKSEMIEIDAGDVDPRLAGCGSLPPAVLSALTLWKGGVVSNGELLELVKKDLNFIRQSGVSSAEDKDKLIEDSNFWGRFAFGERWAEKKARIAASSPEGSLPGWDLVGVIIKSNDDLRQEAFVMQLIELCQEAFEMAGLELWLHPYRILATGRTTGIIEMVRNAMSFDALKKRPGYGRGGLREHLKRMTEFTANPLEAFHSAQKNFVRSLAAYSLLSYFFMFKDRHNGNILLDTAGHVIHIDFGFVFGVAPGGSFSLEMSTPFKITEEMLDVMGGLESPLFSEFVTLFCCGFLALQTHVDTFATIVEITAHQSSFKCFDGRDAQEVVSKMRERFVSDLDKQATVAYALDLIKLATTSYGTKQYDYFQYLSQGIAA